MDDLGKAAALDVNRNLGSTLCSDLDVGEMSVQSAGAAMIFQQNQVRDKPVGLRT